MNVNRLKSLRHEKSMLDITRAIPALDGRVTSLLYEVGDYLVVVPEGIHFTTRLSKATIQPNQPYPQSLLRVDSPAPHTMIPNADHLCHLLETLKLLHSHNYIHGDVKPSNFFAQYQKSNTDAEHRVSKSTMQLFALAQSSHITLSNTGVHQRVTNVDVVLYRVCVVCRWY